MQVKPKLYDGILIICKETIETHGILLEDNSKQDAQNEDFLDKLLNKIKEDPNLFKDIIRMADLENAKNNAEIKQAISKKNTFAKILFFIRVILKYLKVTIWAKIKEVIKKFWDWFKDLPGIRTIIEKIASLLRKNEGDKTFVIGGIEFSWKEVAVAAGLTFVLGGVAGLLVKRVKSSQIQNETFRPIILKLSENDVMLDRKKATMLGRIPDAIYGLLNVLKDIKDATYKMIVSALGVILSAFFIMATIVLLKRPLCFIANKLLKSQNSFMQNLGKFIVNTMNFIDDKLKCNGTFKCNIEKNE